MMRRVNGGEGSIGEHNISGEDIVSGQSIAALKPAVAATERGAAYANTVADAGRCEVGRLASHTPVR